MRKAFSKKVRKISHLPRRPCYNKDTWKNKRADSRRKRHGRCERKTERYLWGRPVYGRRRACPAVFCPAAADGGPADAGDGGGLRRRCVPLAGEAVRRVLRAVSRIGIGNGPVPAAFSGGGRSDLSSAGPASGTGGRSRGFDGRDLGTGVRAGMRDQLLSSAIFFLSGTGDTGIVAGGTAGVVRLADPAGLRVRKPRFL